jgi:hypothetical protein
MRLHKSNTLATSSKEEGDGTPVTLASVFDPHNKNETIKEHILVLLDSGSSHSMAKASLVNKYKDEFFRQDKSVYQTAAGDFTSKYSMNINLKLDEFAENTNIVPHRFDLLNENEDGIGYDMIIGRDLLNDLKIDVRFSDNMIKWEDQLVPMKSFTKLYTMNKHPTRKELQATILRSAEPISTKEATDRAVKILYSKYEPADLDKVTEEATNLNRKQK